MSEYIQLGPESIVQKGFSNYSFTKRYEDLFCYGDRFYQDTGRLILADSGCAEYFLKQIQAGHFGIDDNNALNTLLKLFHEVKTPYGRFKELKPLFINTMEYIEQNISKVTNEDLLLSTAELSEGFGWYYSVGPYCLLANAMSVIRRRAFAEYILALAKHLKQFPEITDLFGGNYLIVSNVKLEGVDEWFGVIQPDNYDYPLAQFTPLSDGRWSFNLNELGPENNFIYMQSAYRGVADLLAYSLCADVELCTWLDD